MRRRELMSSVGGGSSIIDKLANYMTIEALEDGLTVALSEMNLNYKLEYSLDGETWTILLVRQYTPEINTGDVIAFRGVGSSSATSNQGLGTFVINKKCNLLGNCMSLLYGDNAVGNNTAVSYSFNYLFYKCANIISVADDFLPATIVGSYAYQNMFNSCTSMIKGPNLPATTVNTNSYYSMFYGCSSLVNAPKLSATTLATACYYQMFMNCSSLKTAPKLPATILKDSCYSYMFYYCTSLTKAPELPATTLAASCYLRMFNGCSSLTTAPTLPALSLVSKCYEFMFYNCSKLNYIKAMFTTTPSTSYTNSWVGNVSSSGTFVKNKDATWSVTGVSGIPSGWTVKTA